MTTQLTLRQAWVVTMLLRGDTMLLCVAAMLLPIDFIRLPAGSKLLVLGATWT